MRALTRRHGRLIVEAAVLAGMLSFASTDPDAFTLIIGLSFIPLWFIAGGIWLYLRSKDHTARELGFELQPLRDRVVDARTSFFAATAGAIAGLIVAARAVSLIGPVPRWVFLVIIAFAMIENIVPGLGWMAAWRRVWLPQLRRQVEPSED